MVFDDDIPVNEVIWNLLIFLLVKVNGEAYPWIIAGCTGDQKNRNSSRCTRILKSHHLEYAVLCSCLIDLNSVQSPFINVERLLGIWYVYRDFYQVSWN